MRGVEEALGFFATVRGRHSIRAFADRPVASKTLQAILDAANRAPSAGNLQAYEIYVVTHLTTREALARAALDQMFVAQAPVVLVFCAHPTRSARRYGERGRTLYCLQDATIACAYAQLAATALGLATVWVGAFDEEAVRRALGAPPGLRPVAILPVGFPAEAPEITGRRPLEDLVRYIR
ncbi:MAG: nitroreductase family protein [Armatimonadota bacterium]|nr:nitroreductase family protein [Armatimonadota bacterium]MDR7451522.1 nitroreductase family protein [Armatimonadota bacterium]MDR7467489.1 nitroreductase family protein [Armatimonadota bacterium]MDR7494363.1 nitroreductase family protein [Armatimonadota bacterium]MDR7499180.1 nitroreductase family protein [Armatimonadota bacterium]